MDILFLLAGIVIGLALGWFIAKSRFSRPEGIGFIELAESYVQRSMHETVQNELREKNAEVLELTVGLAEYREKHSSIEKRLEDSKQELKEIQERMKIEFENISNRIFEEKSTRFVKLNEERVFNILNPLKERIQAFEEKVDRNYNDETRERASLKNELEHIVKLNQQVSEDTLKLTHALKGDKKLQGDWGEIQLELVLGKAGLEKDIHYRKQENFKDEEGRNQRPDYVINLPEEKNLIIDSKVSLVAYEQYFNEEDPTKQNEFLKLHIQNIYRHILDLASKNYQKLHEINPPDYVLLFVPIEPALYLALKEDTRLFDKALERNIVLVTTSTLLATLRTISYIWKQDNQRRNVAEIARESGELYDKFVGFVEDLISMGKKIDGVKSDYVEAMNKLTESKQKGSTIVGRVERIKKLGANTTKSIPKALLDRIED